MHRPHRSSPRPAATATAEDGARRLTGAKFLAILLGSFAVVASVNGTMVYYALSTFSGEVDPHPYEHGLAYNRDIAAAEAQDARHWQVAAHIRGNGATKIGRSRRFAMPPIMPWLASRSRPISNSRPI